MDGQTISIFENFLAYSFFFSRFIFEAVKFDS